MRKKYIFLIGLFMIFLVSSLQLTTFSNLLNSENLIFTGNENITRNITILSIANITNSSLMLNGIGDYNQSIPLTNNFVGNSEVMYFNFSSNSSSESGGDVLFVRAYPSGKRRIATNVAEGTQTATLQSINCATQSFTSGVDGWVANDYVCINTSEGRIVLMRLYADNDNFVPVNFSWEYLNDTKFYPNNSYIKINNTNIWNYTGEFNTSETTSDFSSTLNTALNGGACDCTGCSLSGDNCTINFLFHSGTKGILEYSNISITWTEDVNPNATIINPIGEKSTTEIPYNVSATDNWETSSCTYWVTRGAGLEVANTSVTCSDSITGSLYVSSQNTAYTFHFFVNDTSGNSNYSTSNFSTAINATIIIPSSGGGGGGTPVVDQTADWTMEAGTGQGIFDINLVIGTSQSRDVLFQNLGDESRTLTLSCEDVNGTGCKYVTFENGIVTLPLIEDIKTSSEFTITAPEGAKLGSYVLNIVAKDEKGREAKVSVFLTIKEIGFLSKISARTEGGFPYILIAIMSFMLSMLISLTVLNKTNIKIKPFISVLISSGVTYLAVLIF